MEARLWKISLILYRFLYCPYHWSIWEPFRNTLSHMPNMSCAVRSHFHSTRTAYVVSFCLHMTCASFNLTSLWIVSTCMGTDPRSTSKKWEKLVTAISYCRASKHALQWPQKVVLPSALTAWLFPQSWPFSCAWGIQVVSDHLYLKVMDCLSFMWHPGTLKIKNGILISGSHPLLIQMWQRTTWTPGTSIAAIGSRHSFTTT